MHPAVAALTPEQAHWLSQSSERVMNFLCELDIALDGKTVGFIHDLGDTYVPPAPPPPSPHRGDGRALRAFVHGPVELPFRVRQVAQLCIEDGLTLDACAERLGIARETVRVHLRRLRELHRNATASARP